MQRCFSIGATVMLRNFRRPIVPTAIFSYNSRRTDLPQIRSYQGISHAVSEASESATEEDEEEDMLHLEQLTRNARTLVRARRLDDAERIVDEGLKMSPWNPALWFWKISTRVGDSAGALEVWDTIGRLGITKGPEHYDIMASALLRADARQILIDLFYETLAMDFVASPRFYAAVFYTCADGSDRLLPTAKHVWAEISSRPQLAHILQDEEVNRRYQTVLQRIEKLQPTSFDAASIDIGSPASLTSTTGQMNNVDVHQATHDGVGPMRSPHAPQGVKSVTGQAVDLPVSHQSASTAAPTPMLDTREGPTLGAGQGTIEPHKLGPFESQRPGSFEPQKPGLFNTYHDTTSLLHKELDSFFRHRTGQAEHKRALKTAKNILHSTNCDIPAYAYVMRNAALTQDSALMMELLQDSIGKGLKPDITLYNPMIRALFSAGKPDEAIDLIDRMDVSNVKYDYRTLVEILRGLLTNDRVDTALQFFVDIFQNESNLSLIPRKDDALSCFNTMIEGLCDVAVNRLADAQKLVAIMVERGLRPTFSTYDALIRASFYNGVVVDAMKYYDLALRIPNPSRLGLHWKEDSDNLVSSVVAGFLFDDRYAEAEKHLSEATKNGHWYGTTSKPFVYFIRWLAKQERIDEAWNLFTFQKNKYTGKHQIKLYTAVLTGIYLRRGDIQGGLGWFQQMKKKVGQLDQTPYEALISSAMLYGDRETAEYVLEDALRYLDSTGEQMNRTLRNTCEKWQLS